MILPMFGCKLYADANLLEQKEFEHVRFTVEDANFKENEFSKKCWLYMGSIPDETAALSAALRLVEIRKLDPNYAEYIKDFLPQHITYYEKNEVWTVSFWEPWPEGVGVCGGAFTIALRRSDGKVLAISWEE